MRLISLTIIKNSHIIFGICRYGGTKILFSKAGCKGHVKSKVEGHCQNCLWSISYSNYSSFFSQCYNYCMACKGTRIQSSNHISWPCNTKHFHDRLTFKSAAKLLTWLYSFRVEYLSSRNFLKLTIAQILHNTQLFYRKCLLNRRLKGKDLRLIFINSSNLYIMKKFMNRWEYRQISVHKTYSEFSSLKTVVNVSYNFNIA